MVQCTQQPSPPLLRFCKLQAAVRAATLCTPASPPDGELERAPPRLWASARRSGAHRPGAHLIGGFPSPPPERSAAHVFPGDQGVRPVLTVQRLPLRAGGSLRPALPTVFPTSSAAEPSQRGKWARRALHGEQRGQTAGTVQPPGFAPSPASDLSAGAAKWRRGSWREGSNGTAGVGCGAGGGCPQGAPWPSSAPCLERLALPLQASRQRGG
ncbi:uncharacterized protein [Oryctolagus cuniculus]|uniref:uncharacterized protein n=1 Tax=Oryctolagus cuniculus TaxID=9986 RepID=UPI00387945DA